MESDKKCQKDEMSSRFFLPFWFVQGVESAFQQGLQDPFSLEGLQLGLPFYDQREWKVFASILCRFQQNLLINPLKMLQLNSQDLMWDLSFSHRYYQQSLVKLLRQIGGLKVYVPKADSYVGKSLFEEETWEMSHNQWVVSLKPHFDTYELLFGTVCAYGDWVRCCLDQFSLTSILGRSKFLSCWKSLWLDLSGVEWLLFMRLEKSKQWQLDGSLLPNFQDQYSENISELFSGVYLGKKRKATMYHFYEFVKKLCLKLYEHGVVDNSYHDGVIHNVKELVNSSRLFYSSNNDNWRLSHLDHKKRVCQLFVERLLVNQKRCFFQMMGLGLSQKLIVQIKQEVCSYLQEGNGVSLKRLFVETKEGQLIPLVLLALEWHFRMQKQQLLGFSGRVENSEFSHKIMRSELLSYRERLECLIQDVEETSFLEFVLTCPLATLATIGSYPLDQNSVYEKYRVELVLYLQGNKVVAKNTVSKKEEPGLSTINSKEGSDHSLLSHRVNCDQEKETAFLKKKCEEELDRLKTYVKKDYLKIQESYIRSLEPKERDFVLAFKEKLHPDIFELHLRQRLVTHMSKGYYDMQKVETSNLQ